MNNDDIQQLNIALKGEHMAIETFDHYIQDADSENLKNKFQDIQRRHKNQAAEISERIQNFGGNPVNTAGTAGIMSEIKMRVSPWKYKKDDVVKSALDGEKFGVDALNQVLSKMQDTSNCSFIQDIISENEKIVHELDPYTHNNSMK